MRAHFTFPTHLGLLYRLLRHCKDVPDGCQASTWLHHESGPDGEVAGQSVDFPLFRWCKNISIRYVCHLVHIK